MALLNAQLHTALDQRTHELESEKKRVEQLLAERSAEVDRLQEEVRAKQEALEYRYDYSGIIGRSPATRSLLVMLDRVIEADASVLILGESGSGKELIAKTIHYNSQRKGRPFVSVNCAALPDSLLESELFGHVRGAFTGADRDRQGLFVAARGGTLFLDELGEMSTAMQVKLLRVLQEREVRPLGSTSSIAVDVRVVCATNRSLKEEVAAGRFREDLYYRIAVVELRVPPLRERPGDVPEIAQALLRRLAKEAGRKAPKLSSSALRALVRNPWPGNVRQLENALTRTFIMTHEEVINNVDLEIDQVPSKDVGVIDRETYERQEVRRIAAELDNCHWNVSEASRRLGIPRNTLYRKLERYRLKRPGSRRNKGKRRSR